MSETPFSRFNLKPYLLQSIENQGFKRPTDIQERLFFSISNGKDALGQSQTGSGKTLAYLLPLVQSIDPKKDEVQVVITAPTRELARQIYDHYQRLVQFASKEEQITCKLIVGGTDRQKTVEGLMKQPQMVIGTPGRLKDVISTKSLLVYTAKTLVVDEADMTFEMGFLESVDFIAKSMSKELQLLVFSATIPKVLEPFLKKYMHDPKVVQVEPKQTTAKNIKHIAISSRHRDKIQLAIQIANHIQPFFAILFVNTKKKAEQLYEECLKAGLNVARLHGDLSPRERKNVMKEVHQLKYQYLVATDLAARGIDIQGVSHVINLELPSELDFYIHRSGRTGRANFDGLAISLYNLKEEEALQKLEKRGITFEYMDFRNDEFVPIEKRKKKQVQKEEKVQVSAKKPKKVKPGYKKKQREQMKSGAKRMKRKGK